LRSKAQKFYPSGEPLASNPKNKTKAKRLKKLYKLAYCNYLKFYNLLARKNKSQSEIIKKINWLLKKSKFMEKSVTKLMITSAPTEVSKIQSIPKNPFLLIF
jgi:predicted patatin/cPLA2 family phospholipase